MQVEISNEDAVRRMAEASGMHSVQDYVNALIKQEADFIAVKEGLADIDAGRVTPLDDFDQEVRERMGFGPRPTK